VKNLLFLFYINKGADPPILFNFLFKGVSSSPICRK
jgi:hypothetical protein